MLATTKNKGTKEPKNTDTAELTKGEPGTLTNTILRVLRWQPDRVNSYCVAGEAAGGDRLCTGQQDLQLILF